MSLFFKLVESAYRAKLFYTSLNKENSRGKQKMPTYINGRIHTQFPVEILPNVYAWDWPPTLSDLNLRLHLEVRRNRVIIDQKPDQEVKIEIEVYPHKMLIDIYVIGKIRQTTIVQGIDYIEVDL